MRWMETIKVQSVMGKEQTTEQELTILSHEAQKNPDRQGLLKVSVMRHASIPGYFALHLFWDSDDPQTLGSLLGMSLSQGLKAFGLVDHSVWIETVNRKGDKNDAQ
jgi:hypothetical protein